MKKKSLYAAAVVAAFALTTATPAIAAESSASGDSVTISGSAGERQTEDGADIRLRFVGDPAPEGYSPYYQRGPSVTVPSPEDAPVTMAGTLDVSAMTNSGTAAILGLYDLDALAAGDTVHKQEVGIWVSYSSANGGTYNVGVTDGDAGGGEWVQEFARIPAASIPDGILTVNFVVDGSADPATCASNTVDVPTADGCMTLTVNGATVTDSYGSVSPDGVDVELGSGAHPGWWVAFGSAGPVVGLLYDLTITPASVPLVLESKDQCKTGGFADFGFTNQGQCIASLVSEGRGAK